MGALDGKESSHLKGQCEELDYVLAYYSRPILVKELQCSATVPVVQP